MSIVFGSSIIVGAVLLLIGFLFDTDHDFDFGDEMPTFVNAKVAGVFLVVFGSGGLYGSSQGWPVARNIGFGLLFGALAGLLVAFIFRLLAQQQASSHVDDTMLLGAHGVVTVRIGANPGEIVVTSGAGAQHSFVAHSVDGIIIPAGRRVRIVQTNGEFVIVEPLPLMRGEAANA